MEKTPKPQQIKKILFKTLLPKEKELQNNTISSNNKKQELTIIKIKESNQREKLVSENQNNQEEKESPILKDKDYSEEDGMTIDGISDTENLARGEKQPKTTPLGCASVKKHKQYKQNLQIYTGKQRRHMFYTRNTHGKQKSIIMEFTFARIGNMDKIYG
ncbi:hypothetical protein BB559_006555, partial [Furculomyces boomerangus]